MGPPRGNHDERVFCCDAGPTRWQPQQILVGVTNDKPVLTPSLLTTDHVDLPPKQRMEWMGNPNRTVYFYCMECSSLVGCSITQRTTLCAVEVSGPVRITHPFHPLFGKEIDFVARQQRWGEDRLVYCGTDGHLVWLPTHWTSVEEQDPVVIVSSGRSYFRAADLIDLAAVVVTLRATEADADV